MGKFDFVVCTFVVLGVFLFGLGLGAKLFSQTIIIQEVKTLTLPEVRLL